MNLIPEVEIKNHESRRKVIVFKKLQNENEQFKIKIISRINIVQVYELEDIDIVWAIKDDAISSVFLG